MKRRFRAQAGGPPLAIEPKALSLEFSACEAENEEIPGGVVVRIEGPLCQRAGFFDGYDSIQRRFQDALDCGGRVVLRINSPGGDVAGLSEAVRAMRAAAERAGADVVAFVDEAAYSAAYALATVANRICLPPSGGVGSIGIITEMIDRTENNDMVGLRVAVIASAAQKTDGHPDVPLAEPALERAQNRVDALARQFAELVAERRGGAAEDYLALQAGTFLGAEAISAGLADDVASWAEVAQVGTPSRSGSQYAGRGKSPQGVVMASEEKKMRRMVKKSEEVEESYASEEESEEAESAEAAEAAEGDEAPESEAPASEAPESKKDARKGESAIVAAARRITGKSNTDEIVGSLEALGHARERAAQLGARVERLERESRRAKVERMVNAAVRAGQITPAQRAWATDLGMTAPKSLKSYLETAPKIARSESTEIGPEGERHAERARSAGSAEDIWSKLNLDPAGQKNAAEHLSKIQTARAAGRN
jgi:ClpP class serine protease